MEMVKLDSPSCGRENQPLTQTEEQLQYRCGACGMVYYGPAKCADDLTRPLTRPSSEPFSPCGPLPFRYPAPPASRLRRPRCNRPRLAPEPT